MSLNQLSRALSFPINGANWACPETTAFGSYWPFGGFPVYLARLRALAFVYGPPVRPHGHFTRPLLVRPWDGMRGVGVFWPGPVGYAAIFFSCLDRQDKR